MEKRELQQLATSIEKNKAFSGKAHLGSEFAPYNVISSGSLSVDYITGVGGITRGIQLELYGRPSIGKTSLAYYMMAEAQKAGRGVGFVGLESPFSPDYAQALSGLDPDQVVAVTPVSGEDASEALYMMVTSGVVGLIVFDSVGAILDTREQETGTRRVGGSALLVSTMINRILRPCWQNECSVIYINQIRSAMNAQQAHAVKTPGGYALEHGVSLRIEMKRVNISEEKDRAPFFSVIDGEKKKIGERIAVTATKNKANSSAGRTAQFNFWTDEVEGHELGLDREQEVIDLAMRLQVIEKLGSYYAHPLFPKNIQGKAGVSEYLKSHQDVTAQIRAELLEKTTGKAEATHVNGNG